MKNQSPLPTDSAIVVRGARVHNLKNITVKIPRDSFSVITGPSGSGKSSLAFDTIYAEGQRRYVESLSVYARQFLDQLEKPDADSIEGLSPTISIEQRTSSYNPRSTVGTVTEIYDYLRLLFSRIGKPHCFQCKKPIHSQSPQQITDFILSYADQTKLTLLAPIARERKGEYQKELYQLRQRGFVRVRVDGTVLDLSEEIALDKNKKHTLEVVVDRIVLKNDRGFLTARLSDSVELALKLGEGALILMVEQGGKKEEHLLSEKFACTNCHISYNTPEPRTFSFNSPMGACPKCEGLGTALGDPPPIDLSSDLSELGASLIHYQQPTPQSTPCKTCNGTRLKKESLHFTISGKNIAELCSFSLESLISSIRSFDLSERETKTASRILKEILARLEFLNQVGVGYLSLDRPAQTLSGGEAQRIRLATQIGSALVGVIYVLDEPSIGLHQCDNVKLLSTLKRLRDLGNTVVVVEHDRDTMEAADWIVDLGPGAGTQGGHLVAQGTPRELKKSKTSVTGQYLNESLKILVPKFRRNWKKDHVIQIEGAKQNNLKNISVSFPLGVLTVVTGISGSGKSTLVLDTLYLALAKELYGVKIKDLQIKKITGLELIDKVIDIDQSPIGKTPRSNPATYTGVFSAIRDLYSSLPEARVRGYAPGRFSFNVTGGRCEACEGDGVTKIEMHFLPDVYVKCEICAGSRYNKETLDIKFKEKNIADVLNMTGSEALSFFDTIPLIKNKLSILNEVGLGYLHLGQSATTLSGGEAQRIKLSKELSKRGTGKTLYILDEPSTGLHFDDIKKLIQILERLVDQGNTVIVIEHNLDIIKMADHIIDLGPGGGRLGGEILVCGTPEKVAIHPKSETGRFLRPALNI